MSVRALRLPVALHAPIARVERDRVVAGVAAGIAESLAVDATLVRLTFAFLAFASGAGILAYLGAWALLAAPGSPAPPRSRRISGTVMLVWSAILTLRGVGLSDSLVWPLALVAAGFVVGTGAATFGLGARWARISAVVLIIAGVALFVGRNTSRTLVDAARARRGRGRAPPRRRAVGDGGSRANATRSGRHACASRSAPSSPRACTTPCSRR